MGISFAPPIVIFVNEEISDGVKGPLQRQLYSTKIETGAEFDSNLASNPDYVNYLKQQGFRTIVYRDFSSDLNKDKADIVLFIKEGLATIEKNNYGPPGYTMPVDRLLLSELILYKNQ